MIVRSLGFDPGSESSGWAFLRAHGQREPALYVGGGTIASKRYDIAKLIVGLRPDLVAIEWIEGMAFAGKTPGVVPALLASAAVAGGIEWCAIGTGHNVIRMPARLWRHQVIGRPSASDAMIKETLPHLLTGLPKRTNVHVRDACGVALAAARQVQAKGAA